MKRSATLVLIAASFFTNFLQAELLSERGIYERCYSKLIRQTPLDDDPFVPQIAAGTLTGANACKQLLNLAMFQTGGQIPAYSTDLPKRELAKRVLASMHDFHASWFHFKTYSGSNACIDAVTNGLIEPQEPALHITRALFHPTFDLGEALTTTGIVRATRAISAPSYSIYNMSITTTNQGFPANFKYIDHGELLGVETGTNPTVTGLRNSRAYPGQPAVEASSQPLRNRGGGLLGSQAYLALNLGENPLIPDLEAMPRNFAKYVFKDLLCRELPVITAADADPYQVCSAASCAIKPPVAQAGNVLAFRRDVACVQCHASMDQLAGVVRNMRQYRDGACNTNATPPAYGGHYYLPFNSTLPAAGWGYLKDPDFHKRVSNGRFYYRGYNGTLHNVQIGDLQELGTYISNMDDFYICAAKRYYRYFTGIDVDLSPMTAAQVNALPPDRKFYRTRVVQLGLALKSTASTGYNKEPAKLIEAIFALPEYKQRDMDLARKATP